MGRAFVGGLRLGRIRYLCNLGCVTKCVLLRPALSVALLLPVYSHELRACHGPSGRLLVEPIAGFFDPLGPGRLSPHLLLLSESLLPLLPAITPFMRRAGCAQNLQR